METNELEKDKLDYTERLVRLEVSQRSILDECLRRSLACEKLFDKSLGICDKCIVKKIVFGLVSVMGLAVVGAIMALILRSPK
jgi:hypothetical protein